MNEDTMITAYARNVGHEPRNLPDDHPDAWQWKYRGTKEERKRLADFLGVPDEEDAAVIEGQESLL